MKKLAKVLTLVLTLILAMAPTTEAQAATTTLKMNVLSNGRWHLDGKKVNKIGNYSVKIAKKSKKEGCAWIDFKAPKAGVYQIKMSNLHCAKNKEGINTKMSVLTKTVDKDLATVSRTCYFAGLKNYSTIQLCSDNYYEFCRSIDKKKYKECVKSATINCKLKKGDHLIISLGGFDGLEGFGTTIDTYAFDMKITKK